MLDRVIAQAATEDKNSSRVWRCTSVGLVCLTAESHYERHERLPRLQANSGRFKHRL